MVKDGLNVCKLGVDSFHHMRYELHYSCEMTHHCYSFLCSSMWCLGSGGGFFSCHGFLHVLFRDSKLTMLLSDSLGNINCQTTMIAHVANSPADYMETLTTVQLASRIHCMKKKKSKVLVQLSTARISKGSRSITSWYQTMC